MSVLPASFSAEALSARYQTEEAQLLGRGKFSVVYRTRRRDDGLSVALKTIQIFEMGTKERNECMNEIKLLQQMNHPHIICYLDCAIEANELVVIMELAEQGDLSGLIKSAAKENVPLAEDIVWVIFKQIADALNYMHERRVMHRDIKPANVFITAPNTVKLGDLGMGRYFSSKTYKVHSTVGTPYYMSPECIQGGGYEFKSDIWSLGCLLYELATLRSPFYTAGLNFYVLGKKIMSRQFEPVTNRSEHLCGLVDQMLQVKPSDRLSAADVLEQARTGGCGMVPLFTLFGADVAHVPKSVMEMVMKDAKALVWQQSPKFDPEAIGTDGPSRSWMKWLQPRSR